MSAAPSDLPKIEEKRLVQLWAKAEEVAMHFNEMILNFRLKALGAITLAGGLVGAVLLTKEGGPPSRFSCLAFSAGMVFLSAAWVAIGVLDLGYYHRLLLGAVREVIRLENLSGDTSQLSRLIKEEAERGRFKDWSNRRIFYALPLLAFWAAAVLAYIQAPPRAATVQLNAGIELPTTAPVPPTQAPDVRNRR